jgi:serine protease AprX
MQPSAPEVVGTARMTPTDAHPTVAPERPARPPGRRSTDLWPNFETGALIHRTVVTTKCQAVHRAFDGLGQDIVWAVLDSGIDADHATSTGTPISAPRAPRAPQLHQ